MRKLLNDKRFVLLLVVVAGGTVIYNIIYPVIGSSKKVMLSTIATNFEFAMNSIEDDKGMATVQSIERLSEINWSEKVGRDPFKIISRESQSSEPVYDLSATIVEPGIKLAIINRKNFKEGDQIDKDSKLLKINVGKVDIKLGNKVKVLSIK
ncbi:MAG: hypothetical protein ACN4E2_05170 [Nitrospinota bacterium]